MIRKIKDKYEFITNEERLLEETPDEVKKFYHLLKEFSNELTQKKKGEAHKKIIVMNPTELVNYSLQLYKKLFDRDIKSALVSVILLKPDETIPKLISIITEEHTSNDLIYNAYYLLRVMKRNLKSFLPKLIEGLKIPNKKIRYDLAKLLVSIDEKEAIPLLIKRMKKDKDWRVRDAAKYAVEEVSIQRGYKSIEDFIRIVENKPFVNSAKPGTLDSESLIKNIRCFKTNQPLCSKDIKLKSKQVFNAMPFRDKYFTIYEEVIKPCLEEKGFTAIKSNDEPKTGDLMCYICELIRESKYAIVNISEWNPNVLFELGLVFGLGKIAILLKDKESKELADLKGMLYIPYEFGFHKELKEELGKCIDANFD